MDFSSLKEQAGKLKDVAGDVQEAATEKVDQLLQEFNEIVPKLKGLGLTIKDFRIGMGLIPEIETKLIGTLDKVDPSQLEQLIEQNQEKTLLLSILKGLKTATEIKAKLGDVIFKGIELDVKLGLPPSIGFRFVE